MRAAALIAALACAGFSVVRDPVTLVPTRWSPANVTITLHADGSDDVSDGSDLTAIRQAMAAWTSVDCAALTFLDGGTTTAKTTGADGQNRVMFIEENWPGAAADATAYTVMVVNATPEPDVWADADVQLNGVDYIWATNGSTRAYDIQHTVTHELGHVLGLRHDASPEATMYWASRRGRTGHRTLHEDDRAGLCFLYPTGSFTCADDDDCPLYLNANGGATVRATCGSGGVCGAGAASFGTDCMVGGDCASGNCQRLDGASTSEVGFCTQVCNPEACPAGSFCGNFGGDDLCAPGYDGCIDTDDCAASNVVCEQDLDGRFHCMRLCLNDGHCSAQAGTVCHGGDGTQPASYCRQPGSGAASSTCADAFDCASLLCGADPLGASRCVGSEVLPPGDDGAPADGGPGDDGGPVTDGGPSDGGPGDDGGPISDGGPVGDGAGGDPSGVGDSSAGADEGLDGEDVGMPPDKRVAGGGCAAAPPGLLGLLLGAAGLACRRRRA